MDRASGDISSDPQVVAQDDQQLADCGSMMRLTVAPTEATYHLVIRGDSASSTVRATARFAMVRVVTPGQANNGGMVECASRGAWERMIVREVQTAAERNGSG